MTEIFKEDLIKSKENLIKNKTGFDPLFENGGEMSELIRNFNWSETEVGAIGMWPQSLRTTLSIIIHSKFPMFLFWGPELICFYNDAYRLSLGNDGKHPIALGSPGQEVWPEIWHIIHPLIIQVLAGEGATWNEDQLIPIYRNGKLEDVYWTFSYSPVFDESAQATGVFVTCCETTGKVINLKQLAESNNQLEFAIEATELGTWDLDPVTNKFTGNKRLKEWFGIKPENEIELPLALNAIAEYDRKRVTNAIGEALQFVSGGLYDIKYTIVNPVTKVDRIVRAKGRAWFNEEKIAYRFNGTLEDVTEETIAKRELAESKIRLELVVEQLEIALAGGELGTFDFFPQSQKLLWSARTKELFGLPPDAEVDYQTYLQGLHPDDKETSNLTVQKALQHGEHFYDSTYRTIGINDGRLRWIQSKGKISFNESGEAQRFTGITQDITKAKNAEAALRESESRFRQLSDSNIIGIVFWNVDGKLKYPNEAFLKMIEASKDDVTSGTVSWIELTAPAYRELDNIMIEKLVRTRTAELWEKQFILRSGKHVDVLIGVAMLEESVEDGIAFLLDISEQKNIQQELEWKNEQLVRTNNDLDNFIYTASHDLKAPIANLQGLIDALESDLAPSPNLFPVLDMMKASILRFRNTIDDLTDIGKAQKADEEDIILVKFSDLLEEMEVVLKEQLQSSKGVIIPQIEVDELRFSKKNLRSIIYNLLSNAIKYMSPLRIPMITVVTRQEGDNLILTVRDNGLGISVDNQKKMFGMFKRFHNHVEGTGVGLYIVKRIIDNAGGKIEVDSVEGEGTIFKVTFKNI